MLICFKCSNIYAGQPTDRAMPTGSFLGSPNTPELVRLAQEAFPDDKEIQGLSPGEK